MRTVVIIINKDHSMLINAEPTDEHKLGARLEEIFKTRAERVVFVKGDPDLRVPVCGQSRSTSLTGRRSTRSG